MTYNVDFKVILDLTIRILAASLCGAVIGLERKKRLKEAGIRTHSMVALGAAVFGIVSKYGFLDFALLGLGDADVSRVAANVVTGVCFLGAGMIFVYKKSVLGLTTSAGIWAVSAVGLSFGCGLYSVGIISTVVIAVIQYVIYKPLIRLEGRSPIELVVEISEASVNLDNFIKEMKSLNKPAVVTCVNKMDNDTVRVTLEYIREADSSEFDAYDFMKKYPYVTYISV